MPQMLHIIPAASWPDSSIQTDRIEVSQPELSKFLESGTSQLFFAGNRDKTLTNRIYSPQHLKSTLALT
jgi:hypothetical protein